MKIELYTKDGLKLIIDLQKLNIILMDSKKYKLLERRKKLTDYAELQK